MCRLLVVVTLLAIAPLDTGVSCHRERLRLTAERGEVILKWYCRPEEVLFKYEDVYRCVEKCAECPNGFCHENECHCFPGIGRDRAGVCGQICKDCENGWCSSVTKCECNEGFTLSQGRCVLRYQANPPGEHQNLSNGMSPQSALKLSSQLATQLNLEVSPRPSPFSFPHWSHFSRHRPHHDHRSHFWRGKHPFAHSGTRHPMHWPQDPSNIWHSQMLPETPSQPLPQYPPQNPSNVRPQQIPERPVQGYPETSLQPSSQYPSQHLSGFYPQTNTNKPHSEAPTQSPQQSNPETSRTRLLPESRPRPNSRPFWQFPSESSTGFIKPSSAGRPVHPYPFEKVEPQLTFQERRRSDVNKNPEIDVRNDY